MKASEWTKLQKDINKMKQNMTSEQEAYAWELILQVEHRLLSQKQMFQKIAERFKISEEEARKQVKFFSDTLDEDVSEAIENEQSN